MKEKAPPPAEEPQKETDDPEPAALSAKSGNRTMLIIIAVAAMAVSLGGIVAAPQFLGKPAPSEETGSASAAPDFGPGNPPPIDTRAINVAENFEPALPGADSEGREATVHAPDPVNVEFKPFIVNLEDVNGRRFLKLTLSVEAESEAQGAEINSQMPRIRHDILLLLAGLPYDELATLEGKMKLRRQMLNHINSQLTGGKVNNIYFSEFVIQ